MIYKLRVAENAQRLEIEYLRDLVEESRTHTPSHLITHDKMEIADYALKSESFRQYAVRVLRFNRVCQSIYPHSHRLRVRNSAEQLGICHSG